MRPNIACRKLSEICCGFIIPKARIVESGGGRHRVYRTLDNTYPYSGALRQHCAYFKTERARRAKKKQAPLATFRTRFTLSPADPFSGF